MPASKSATATIEATPSDPGRVVFRRHVGDKVTGAIVYLIAGPFFGALLGLIFGLLAFGLLYATFHLSEDHAAMGGLVVAALALLLGLVWAYREFRRRSGTQLIIEPEAIEYVVGRRSVRCTTDQMTGVRLANAATQVVIDRATASPIRIPTDFLRAKDLVPRLRTGPLVGVAVRHESSLAAGHTLEVRDLRLSSIPLAARELLRLLLGLICLPGLHFAAEGVRNINLALAGIRFCARGLRGGFIVTREGLADPRDPTRRLPWNQVTSVRLDASGLRIDGPQGRAFTASPYATHYCDICVLLELRGFMAG